MNLKWVCTGRCSATYGLYDLAGPHHDGGACLHGWFFNGLLTGFVQAARALRAALGGFRLGAVGRFCSAKGRLRPESSRASADHAAFQASDTRSPRSAAAIHPTASHTEIWTPPRAVVFVRRVVVA
jgi:hypothetical protein